jgi:dTMP kinase
MSGHLITLEGLDGSGKTTQMELLENNFPERGIHLRRVKFPVYEKPFSAPVRMYLNGDFGKDPDDVNAYASSVLFAVDRFASFRTMWHKDYENGALILADRYTTSNMIYQLPKLPKEEWDSFISWLQDLEYEKLGLPKPDLTVYLDMPPEISQTFLDRRCKRSGEQKDIHERDVTYLNQCHKSAAFAARKLGWQTVACAEGGSPKSRETVHAEIVKIISAALRKWRLKTGK